MPKFEIDFDENWLWKDRYLIIKYELSWLPRRFIADHNFYTIDYVMCNFDINKRLWT